MMRSGLVLFLGVGLNYMISSAQPDTTLTSHQETIYKRPFIIDAQVGKTRTALGGYLEGNTNYFSENGVSEGFSMEMRRFNIFMHSQLGQKIRFISELEFEHGTEEIALETALLDFEWYPALRFRAGVLLPSIGLVNTNHDSPNWEFIDRPLSSTQLIPTTLSEIGFGLHGSFYPGVKSVISYNAYIVNGLQDNVILNEQGRTHLPSGKSEGMLGEDNNGSPMLNARVGYRYRGSGKIGWAYYGGIYNQFQKEGEQVESKRFLHLTAIDFVWFIQKLTVKGEVAYANVDVPTDIVELYGTDQYSGFVDIIYPVLDRSMLGFEEAKLNLSLRLERVDYHMGHFTTNITTPIRDENTGVAFGIGFRPRNGTIIRANYRYHWLVDEVGNPPVMRAGFQFGVASYF